MHSSNFMRMQPTRCNIKLPCCKGPLCTDMRDLLMAGLGKGFPFRWKGMQKLTFCQYESSSLQILRAHFRVYEAPSRVLTTLSLITTGRGRWTRHYYCYDYCSYPHMTNEKAKAQRLHSHAAAEERPALQLTRLRSYIPVSKKSFE